MTTTAGDIELRQTCAACPEQYDAYLNGELVGYLRLRHGHFRVHVPDSEGGVVYAAEPVGDGFFMPFEREAFLSAAREAIAASLRHGQCECPCANCLNGEHTACNAPGEVADSYADAIGG